jgi:hypothetical protein
MKAYLVSNIGPFCPKLAFRCKVNVEQRYRDYSNIMVLIHRIGEKCFHELLRCIKSSMRHSYNLRRFLKYLYPDEGIRSCFILSDLTTKIYFPYFGRRLNGDKAEIVGSSISLLQIQTFFLRAFSHGNFSQESPCNAFMGLEKTKTLFRISIAKQFFKFLNQLHYTKIAVPSGTSFWCCIETSHLTRGIKQN